MIKKFESFGTDKKSFHPGWQDDFLYIYDLFCELEDSKVGRFDYQAGVKSSTNNGFQYTVFLKDGEVFGDEDFINNAHWGKLCFKVSIFIFFEHGNYSPFRTQYSSSYFDENADKFLEIMSMISSIKNRSTNYKVGVTLESNFIIINFLSE